MARRRTRIDRLLDQQASELAELSTSQVAEVLQAYEDARRSLLERLQLVSASTPETQHRLRVMLAQAEAGVGEMKRRMGQAMASGEVRAHRTAMRHLLELIRAQEAEFRDSGGGIEVQIVRRLAALQNLALHRYSVERYGAQTIDAVQRALVAGVVQGMTPFELAQQVAGAGGSTLAGQRGRAELIVRMETARAYNDAHLESVREVERSDPRPDDPMLKRIDEYMDARNHPFSRAAHGATAKVDEPFRVSVAAVHAAATALKKPIGGVLWPREGAHYVGHNLPAHFNERGRIIGWRASWAA